MRFVRGSIALGFAILIVAGFAVASGPVTPAHACTIGPIHWSFARADEIFEGRVISATELPEDGDDYYRTFDLTVTVTVAHRGVASGNTLPMRARVPGPGPVMCPQFNRDETFVGKYFVTAWQYEFADVRTLGVIPYFGEGPFGTDYEGAVRLVHVVLADDPALPTLKVFAANSECATKMTVVGTGFSPGGKYSLYSPGGFPYDPRSLEVAASADGRIYFSFDRIEESCPNNEWSFIEASEADTGFTVALVSLADAIVGAPERPDAGNSPPAAAPASTSPLAAVVVLAGVLLTACTGLALRRKSETSGGN
jgi:hypothetical protein